MVPILTTMVIGLTGTGIAKRIGATTTMMMSTATDQHRGLVRAAVPVAVLLGHGQIFDGQCGQRVGWREAENLAVERQFCLQ